MTEIQMTKTTELDSIVSCFFVLNFEHLNFEFVSNFDIRISYLKRWNHHTSNEILFLFMV